jgi:ABC-type transporter Mla subunit MlaD
VDRTEPLIERTGAVLRQTEPLVERAGEVLDQAQPLVKHAGDLADRAGTLIARAEPLAERVDPLVTQADELVGRAGGLLAEFEPSLRTLEPVLNRLAESTSPAEVDAAIQLIDTLPELVQAMETDVLPIMKTLGTVAPDLRDLLDTSKELNEILGSLPGLGRIKKRVEERQEQEDQDRLANEDPPRSPDEVR